MPSTQPVPETGSKAPEQPGYPKHYPRYTTASNSYAHEVESFLEDADTYDVGQKRWSIPGTLTKRETLVDTLYSILLLVVQQFVKPNKPGVERHIFNIQGYLQCKQKDGNGHAICPVLTVPAMGPSFELPQALHSVPRSQLVVFSLVNTTTVSLAPYVSVSVSVFAPSSLPFPLLLSTQLAKINLGYSCMATYFTVKLESNTGSAEEQVDEMETYARFSVINPTISLFTRWCSESHAHVVHFDHAGAEITPPFDIHWHPATLVRLVAGLCSADERILGFDKSIQWTMVYHKKAKGTVTTTGPNGDLKTYPILKQIRTPWNNIQGHATTCWLAHHPDTLKDLVIKDVWHLENLRGEYELLELVKDTPGETKDFSSCNQDRIAQWLEHPPGVGKVLGSNPGLVISFCHLYSTHFTSVVQLLSALRDAIADSADQTDAFQVTKGLLLMISGYSTGVYQPITCFLERTTHQKGLPILQSVSVLSTVFERLQDTPYDYLDDLQLFFYLLVYIMLLFKPDGSCVPGTEEGPSIIISWDERNPRCAFTNKEGLTGGNPLKYCIGGLIRASWGRICKGLFMKFCAWTLSRRGDKERLLFQKKGAKNLLPKREEHYSAVLEIFDEAIQAVLRPR
ncbi:hypothetical protein FA13DRAFT_1716263 [Coprinellus micaceus]|uniref:Fungal-type protein kinase domain-containing protein n=1 Tax=Coprinellus micaceus TaxID=71717 RepID=A0A4Y7SKG2_COPMI|nr:hypothetical protein FA13DRAFT_1716263 [Coprinellus micaceus]